jgi:hypothetical protein
MGIHREEDKDVFYFSKKIVSNLKGRHAKFYSTIKIVLVKKCDKCHRSQKGNPYICPRNAGKVFTEVVVWELRSDGTRSFLEKGFR